MMVMMTQWWRGEQKRAGGRVRLRAHYLYAVHSHPLELIASLGDGRILGAALRVLACGCIVQRNYYD